MSGEGKQRIDFLPQPPGCRCPHASPKQRGRRAQRPAGARVLAATSPAPPGARGDLAPAPPRRGGLWVWRPGPNLQGGAVSVTSVSRRLQWLRLQLRGFSPPRQARARSALGTAARALLVPPSPWRAGDRAEVSTEVSCARAGRAPGAAPGERGGREPAPGGGGGAQSCQLGPCVLHAPAGGGPQQPRVLPTR